LEEAKRSNLRHRPIGLGAQKNGAAIMIDDVLDGDGLMAMDFLESIQYIESSIHSSNIYILVGGLEPCYFMTFPSFWEWNNHPN